MEGAAAGISLPFPAVGDPDGETRGIQGMLGDQGSAIGGFEDAGEGVEGGGGGGGGGEEDIWKCGGKRG